MTPVSKLVLFGSGDFARIALRYFQRDSELEPVAFTVHREYISEPEVLGLPVIPFEEISDHHPPGEAQMFVAIGFSRVNQARAAMYEECKAKGYTLASYVSSQCWHLEDLEIGDNTFIFESNVIQPFVTIGSNTILWSGNHIGHDATIGNHVFIASHAVVSGNVTIGDYCFVGVNATFRDAITVAPKCVIGAGAIVMRDTEEGDVLSVPGTKPYSKKSWEINL
jgi:sugar O-acyltransferase (sialic acid O-acetyltransferase NeuD family)